MRNVSLLTCVICLAGCQPVSSIGQYDEVVLTGWLSIRGEMMIFNEKEDLKSRNIANCISGVPDGFDLKSIGNLNGRRVVVEGRRVNYDLLERSDVPAIQRGVLNGFPIENFCLKPFVVSVKRISLAQ